MSNLPYNAKHPVISHYRRNVTSQNLSSPTSIIKVIITPECTLRSLNYYDRNTGLSMGEKKLSDGNEIIMYANLEENAEVNKSMMAPLPQARLGKSLRSFAHCGVDFAGAFVIKLPRRVTAKRCLCLFTCVSTRAVYLEIAYSLDTASFLNAFSRMVARRGKPEVMISDNGTNFPSSDRELRDLVSTLDQSRIKEHVVHDAIQWRFTSPLP